MKHVNEFIAQAQAKIEEDVVIHRNPFALQGALYPADPQQPKESMKLRITHEPWVSPGQYLVERVLEGNYIPLPLQRFNSEDAARDYVAAFLRGPRVIAEFTASEGETA